MRSINICSFYATLKDGERLNTVVLYSIKILSEVNSDLVHKSTLENEFVIIAQHTLDIFTK